MMFGLLMMLLVVGLPILVVVLLVIFGIGLLRRNYPSQPAAPQASTFPPAGTRPSAGPPAFGRYCSHCGAGLQADWTHCPQCGAPVQ